MESPLGFLDSGAASSCRSIVFLGGGNGRGRRLTKFRPAPGFKESPEARRRPPTSSPAPSQTPLICALQWFQRLVAMFCEFPCGRIMEIWISFWGSYRFPPPAPLFLRVPPPLFPRILLSGNHQTPRGNSRFLKRTMVETNGWNEPLVFWLFCNFSSAFLAFRRWSMVDL